MARSNIEMQRKRNRDGALNSYVFFMNKDAKDWKKQVLEVR